MRGRTDGPVLRSSSPSGEGFRLTRFGADYLIKQVDDAAGLGATLSANGLRRAHIAGEHSAGVSLDDIGRRVGHNDVRTTVRLLPGKPKTARDGT